ncbi:HAD family phosphatase [Puniceicoccales bacterium CK1056]|uniref:HAD family phosphatase n=1 Tax=Oceanipulchritudo coccoides TaxID=2706888 RepID=A0A6B2LZU6_9BACT|nr:HAD family phosphatase [Oceanipulchritudo coccoides]NDV61579.1 HAD family phosphatase [Oceanipulchritudo coccoides]
MNKVQYPNLGETNPALGLQSLERTSDNRFFVGEGGVGAIGATGDGKVEFVGFEEHTLALVKSAMGYPAYYPVDALGEERPLKAVLMDLDGTTVHSESFWIWIIERSIGSLLGKKSFQLEEEDIPYVSGHSVSEHLQYCIEKYCPDKLLETARAHYFKHTHREMQLILEGKGREGAFEPSPGIKPFLEELKAMGLKIGLVTSGLYEKAYPEILDAFRTLGMGDPADFYDAIITAGHALRKGQSGTLGELSPKPHPWLYAETFRVGLGMDYHERNAVIGIEDSGAGVVSIRLAGMQAWGIGGGNIEQSGTKGLCSEFSNDFEGLLKRIRLRAEA